MKRISYGNGQLLEVTSARAFQSLLESDRKSGAKERADVGKPATQVRIIAPKVSAYLNGKKKMGTF
jgi:hypothetical protein